MAISRGVPQDMIDGLTSGMFHPVSLVEVEWSDGEFYRFHTGFGELEWDGKTWLPAAYLAEGKIAQIGTIEIPEENLSIATADAGLSIAATLDALLATQAEYQRGLEVVFYFGVVTEPAGNVMQGDAIKTFTGITSGNGLAHTSPSFDMQITSGVPARASASIVHSTEDQRARGFTNDTGFDRLGVAQKWRAKGLQWPE